MAGHTAWVNYVATSLFSLTGIIVSKGNHPQMAARFRLVKYYNLPRYMHSHRIIKKACNVRETVWTWEVIPIDGRIMSFLLFMVAWHNIHPIWMRDVPFQSDGLATLVSSRNSVHQSEFANVLSHVPPIEKGCVLSESEVGCKLMENIMLRFVSPLRVFKTIQFVWNIWIHLIFSKMIADYDIL